MFHVPFPKPKAFMPVEREASLLSLLFPWPLWGPIIGLLETIGSANDPWPLKGPKGKRK